MDLHHALRTRRTIQRFVPGPIPDEIIDRALAEAVYAPNHKTTWPFRFVLPQGAAREALFRVGLRLKAGKRGGAPTPELEAKVRADMLVPDRLIVVVQELSPGADPVRTEEDYAATACAAYALMLSLHADGFGAKWGTGGTTRDPEAFEVLGLDPARHRVVAFVWAGVPEIVPQVPARPPLSELVRRVG
jgi:nitroreductase